MQTLIYLESFLFLSLSNSGEEEGGWFLCTCVLRSFSSPTHLKLGSCCFRLLDGGLWSGFVVHDDAFD